MTDRSVETLAFVRRRIEERKRVRALNGERLTSEDAAQIHQALVDCRAGVMRARRALKKAGPLLLDVTGAGARDVDAIRRRLDRAAEAVNRARETWRSVDPYGTNSRCSHSDGDRVSV